MAKEPITVVITGAAGQIGYSLIYMISSGKWVDSTILLDILKVQWKLFMPGSFLHRPPKKLKLKHETQGKNSTTAQWRQMWRRSAEKVCSHGNTSWKSGKQTTGNFIDWDGDFFTALSLGLFFAHSTAIC